MVCPTKCTWGCRTCLYLFWRICSTIGSPREPSLVALPRAWSQFRRWISMMYHNPQAVVLMNGKRSRAFAIERSVRQDCSLSPLLYVVAFEPLLRRLRDERTNSVLRGVLFAGSLTARVSAFADDITVFVSRRLDIKAVKKASTSGSHEPR